MTAGKQTTGSRIARILPGCQSCPRDGLGFVFENSLRFVTVMHSNLATLAKRGLSCSPQEISPQTTNLIFAVSVSYATLAHSNENGVLNNGDLLVVMTDLSQKKLILGATVILESTENGAAQSANRARSTLL